MKRALFAIAAAATLTGCFSRAQYPIPMDLVREQLQCPSQPVEIHDIDDRTRGAIGCGRRRAFVMICDYTPAGAFGMSVDTQCIWELDPPSTAPVVAAPPPMVFPTVGGPL